MPLKDTQTFSSVSLRKFKLKEAPGPGVQHYPTAEAYLKFTNIRPVTKVLYLHLFSARRISPSAVYIKMSFLSVISSLAWIPQ